MIKAIFQVKLKANITETLIMSYLEPILVIFLIISVGIGYARSRTVSADHIEGLDSSLFRIFMPCYFFTLMYNYDLVTLLDGRYSAAFLAAFLTNALLIYFIVRPHTSHAMAGMHIFVGTYVNSAVFALPVTIYLLQDPRAAVLGNFLQIILIQTCFVIFFSLIRGRDVSWRQRLNSLFVNPMLLMPLAGLMCNSLQISPHSIVLGAIKALGDAAPAVALFNFGLSLGTTRRNDLVLSSSLYKLVVIKNLAHPTLSFLLGYFCFGLRDYWLWALILMTAAPPGFMTLRLAKTFNLNPPLIKNVMVVSGIVSLVLLFLTALILSGLHITLAPVDPR